MATRITISGVLGSGKSTVCKELQKKYHFSYFSTGALQRKIADDKGMSTYELNRYSEKHPEIDQLIDNELINLSSSTDNIVIDSRMAWHFVKGAFKVYLTTDETVAAQRVIEDDRGFSESYSDIADAREKLSARKKSENYRYGQKYDVDCHNFKNYDLIIDTTEISPDIVAEHIMIQFKKWEKKESYPIFWLSPKILYPTQSIREISIKIVEKYIKKLNENKELYPIDIVVSGGFCFIYDGHHRVAAYAKKDYRLIPCNLVGQDDDVVGKMTVNQYVSGEFSSTKAYDWEDYIDFRYLTYPKP